MSTRDRILLTTLGLFNEDGVAKVSINRIAAELEISAGNLHYHFKNKEQLVDWLFRRLESELRPFIESGESLSALDDVWLSLHLVFEAIERYRFIYTDIDYLVREYPGFGQRMRKMTLTTMETIRSMCRNLAATGVIRVESDEIESLTFQIMFTATCWSTFARLVGIEKTAGPAFAAYHTLTLMSPYLDDNARHYMNYLRTKYLR